MTLVRKGGQALTTSSTLDRDAHHAVCVYIFLIFLKIDLSIG